MKPWREAASLIVAARNATKTSEMYNYKLLFLKRKSTGSFGGAYVFPGGIIDPSDADLKWEGLFKNHGFDEKSFKYLVPTSKKRPEIFDPVRNELPREVSLRISAIRETFEECGLLFCSNSPNLGLARLGCRFILTKKEVDHWQKKVHDNSTEFYNMCIELNCYPNVWGLYEWRTWMSSSNFATARRINTALFFTGLPAIPEINLDYSEIVDSMWAPPDFMLENYRTSLFPPQQYELSKLSKYKDFESLLFYAMEKSQTGAERYYSVAVGLIDGLVFLLPGDSMYPKDIDITERPQIDMSNMTIKQFRDISDKTHRIEIFNDPESKDRIPCKL